MGLYYVNCMANEKINVKNVQKKIFVFMKISNIHVKDVENYAVMAKENVIVYYATDVFMGV